MFRFEGSCARPRRPTKGMLSRARRRDGPAILPGHLLRMTMRGLTRLSWCTRQRCGTTRTRSSGSRAMSRCAYGDHVGGDASSLHAGVWLHDRRRGVWKISPKVHVCAGSQHAQSRDQSPLGAGERPDGRVQKIDGTKVPITIGATRCIAVRAKRLTRCIPIEQVRRAGYRDGTYTNTGFLIGLGVDAVLVGGILVFIAGFDDLPSFFHGPFLRF